ncbi:hypothetical protein pdam_00015573 [Pocillopora damicornis]|uniref:EGF-like domain-containing protein n=1 Tax=Pocillopora damicornis TaxID=46731 RepID=A0A3M6UIB0_POCDA|nr:hypothetical protein pdam_00015573 [Pocillopora damicornis]
MVGSNWCRGRSVALLRHENGRNRCWQCFLSITFKLDIDECKGNKNVCDENAKCSNTVGSSNCTCKDGFIGDGHSRSGKKL